MTNIFSVTLLAEKERLIEFLKNPINLSYWIVHTHWVVIEDICYEINSSTGEKTEINITYTNHYLEDFLDFTWILEGKIKKQFRFSIRNGSDGKITIGVLIPSPIVSQKIIDLQSLLKVEFKILEQLLNDRKYELTESEKTIMTEYHNKYVNNGASVT